MKGPKKRRQGTHERPYVSDLELKEALSERLSDRELNALEKQIRRAVEMAVERACKQAVEETHLRAWAIVMRVLRDRFGWGRIRLTRLWNMSKEYLKDIESGIITIQELLDTLEHEDGIIITWTAHIRDSGD